MQKQSLNPSSPLVLLTIPEAMELLRVSRATIYNLVSQRAISHVKIGNATRLIQSELFDYIKARTIGPMQEAA